VLQWDSAAAARYGTVRAATERAGENLASLDMLIAAHALQIEATLVTNDRAFRHVAGLHVEDWTD
jgi:tRNA(fMet)-specific endonuclease VapC